MGAWNYQILCDDVACDAADEIMDSEDLYDILQNFLSDTMDAEGDYVDYDAALYGLTAAAFVDAIINGPLWDILVETDYEDFEIPKDYEKFIQSQEEKKEKLKTLCPDAVKVIEIVLSDESEIRELWEENEELYPKWKNNILKLKERLIS